jgi:molecular chaperone HscB
MDYFEFYDISLSFQPDQVLVKKKFYALSKAYHPDFYITEPEEKQQEILGLSTLNNKAFQTLSHTDQLLPYILILKGVLTEGEKYILPQDFLMEMMEVNESIMELEIEEDGNQAKKVLTEVDDFDTSLNAEFQQAVEKFNHSTAQDQEGILLQIKDIWYRKKYLLRIRESINKFAAR